MENKFTIRQAVRSDSKTIFNFIQKIAEYEKMTDEVEGDEKAVERTLFDENQAECIIGEENGVPVGFALYFFNYSTFKTKHGLYLEDLYVDNDKRGKGYGKMLLLKLAEIAHSKNCGRMEWCCLDWNTPSIEFYKSLGAEAMSGWTTYRLNEEQLKKFSKE